MEPEGSVSCSQQSTSGPYPESDISNPHLKLRLSLYLTKHQAMKKYLLLN